MRAARRAVLSLLLVTVLVPAANSQSPKLDTWSDPLPEGAISRLGTGRFCLPDSAGATAWSPRGDRFASACYTSPTTIVWDWPSGKKLHSLPVQASHLEFSPDGKWLVTQGADLKLWDVVTGKAQVEFLSEVRPVPRIVAFSRDATWLAVMGDFDLLYEWNLRDRTFRKHNVPASAHVMALVYDKNNELWASGKRADKTAVWQVAKDWQTRDLTASSADLHCMAFSPDAEKLAVPLPDLGISVFETATGKLWAELQGGHVDLRFALPKIRSLRFNFDGTRLASASWDTTVCVWDVNEKKKLFNIRELNGTAMVSFSADGKLLATGGPNHPHRAVFWDAVTGQRADPYVQHYSPLHSLAFSANGGQVATVSGLRDDPWIYLWETTTGKPIRSLFGHPGGCSDAKFSPEGTLLATGGKDRTVKIWEIATGKNLHTFQADHSWVTCLAFSPDAKLLAYGDNFVNRMGKYFGKTCIWDVREGKLVQLLEGQEGPIDSIAFTPDGKRLLTGAKGIRVWKVGSWTMEQDLAMDIHRVRSLAVSRDGRFVFTGHVGPPRLWELQTGQVAAILQPEWTGFGDISPDGQTVALTTFTNKLLLWHWPTQKVVVEHDGAYFPVVFSPEGDRIATGEAQVPAALVWQSPAAVALEKSNYNPKTFAEAWKQLAGPAQVAYPAMWQCVRMGDVFLPDLRKQWHLDDETGLRIRMWIAQLNDANFKVRDQAQRELERAGSLAMPFIKQAVTTPATEEQRRRLEKLLKLPAPLDVVQRRRRTVMLLEHIGTPAAVQTLIELNAAETDGEFKDDVQSTLARLRHRVRSK